MVFGNQNDAEVAEYIIWVMKVHEASDAGEKIKDVNEVFYDDLTDLPDEQIADLKICGKLQGQSVTDNGTTTSYAEVLESPDERYYFPKPEEQKYIDACAIIPFDIIELPAAWVVPVDEIWD